MFWTSWSFCLVDRCLEPGGWTADLLCSLAFQQRQSQDDFRVTYSGEKLRLPWKVAHHWDKWDRLEQWVGNLKEAIAARCKPPVSPPSLLQEDQEDDQQKKALEIEEDEQDKEVQETKTNICTYFSCPNSSFSFSPFFLSQTVPKLIGIKMWSVTFCLKFNSWIMTK